MTAALDPNARVGPLSFMQEQIWAASRIDRTGRLYNRPFGIKICGIIDAGLLERCINLLPRRFEILATLFPAENGRAVQQVRPGPVPFEWVDLLGIYGRERRILLARVLRRVSEMALDAQRGPIFRAVLVRLSRKDHLLLFAAHHLAMDATSAEIIRRELARFYDSRASLSSASSDPMPVQFIVAAAEERRSAENLSAGRTLEFWREHLAQAPTEIDLAPGGARGGVTSAPARAVDVRLTGRLAQAIRRLAAEERATTAMVLEAAFAWLAGIHASQNDIVVGTFVPTRTSPAHDNSVGPYIDVLPVRFKLGEDSTFRELLRQARRTLLECYVHREAPFGVLLRELNPKRVAGRTPLVQITFNYERLSEDRVSSAGLTFSHFEVAARYQEYDLSMEVAERAGVVSAQLAYRTDLFDEKRMRTMARQLERLLTEVTDKPDTTMSDVELLAPADKEQLLREWNRTSTDYPRDAGLTELFEEQVRARPGAAAAEFGELSLSYRELNEAANRFARFLIGRIERGGATDASGRPMGSGRVIPIIGAHSIENLVAILGVLKCGAAYFPLSSDEPLDRLARLISDTGAPFVVVTDGNADKVRSARFDVVCYEEELRAIEPERCDNLDIKTSAETPAYVIGTSGSTGEPKRIVLPHRAAVRLVRNTSYIDLKPSDRVALHSAVSFDAVILEMWGALLNGSTLVHLPLEKQLSPTELRDYLERKRITFASFTTSHFNWIVSHVPDAFNSLRLLDVGGEQADRQAFARARAAGFAGVLINTYAPAEAGTIATWYSVPRKAFDIPWRVPIGRPISNAQVYVLTNRLRPAAIGVPGEICIGGDGLALGYLNDPSETALRFVANPFGPAGSRLYRSGDRGRISSDGNIEFLGRVDDQIKIRGFRVEPDEVVSAICGHPAVRSAAVLAQPAADGSMSLLAFVEMKSGSAGDARAILDFLKLKVPAYMIPAKVVIVPEIPLNSSGKTDRHRLRALAERTPDADDVAATVRRDELSHDSSVSARLADIWEDLLGSRPRSGSDDFFDLGGHSLRAAELFIRILDEFECELPISAIFSHSTLASQAALIRELSRTNRRARTGASGVAGNGGEPVPLNARAAGVVPGAGGPALFWTADIAGDVAGYVDLAIHLDKFCPVYGLKRWRATSPARSIGQLAEESIDQLKLRQPKGPYYLAGHSLGGFVAFEMARRLVTSGEQVEKLLIVDSRAARRYRSRRDIGWAAGAVMRRLGAYRDQVRRHRDRVLALPLLDAVYYVAARVRSGAQRLRYPHSDVAVGALSIAVPKSTDDLLRRYRVQGYPGRITLLRANDNPGGFVDDETLGWGAVAAGGVDVVEVQGDHGSVMREPNAGMLAARIRDVMSL